MERPREALRDFWRSGIGKRALLVALIVGTVLNLINQGDALLAARGVDWVKVVLTYFVPFCVSAHGALSARRS